MATDHARA